jgi:hypothetical protein
MMRVQYMYEWLRLLMAEREECGSSKIPVNERPACPKVPGAVVRSPPASTAWQHLLALFSPYCTGAWSDSKYCPSSPASQQLLKPTNILCTPKPLAPCRIHPCPLCIRLDTVSWPSYHHFDAVPRGDIEQGHFRCVEGEPAAALWRCWLWRSRRVTRR